MVHRLRLLWGDQVKKEELKRIRPSLRISKHISCFKVVPTCSPRPAAEQWLEWVVVAVVAHQGSCARVRCGSDKKGVVATQSSWGFKAVVHVSQVVGGWIGYSHRGLLLISTAERRRRDCALVVRDAEPIKGASEREQPASL